MGLHVNLSMIFCFALHKRVLDWKSFLRLTNNVSLTTLQGPQSSPITFHYSAVSPSPLNITSHRSVNIGQYNVSKSLETTISSVRVCRLRQQTGLVLVHHARDFLPPSSPDREPVKLTSDVIAPPSSIDQTCGSVLDRLWGCQIDTPCSELQ